MTLAEIRALAREGNSHAVPTCGRRSPLKRRDEPPTEPVDLDRPVGERLLEGAKLLELDDR